MGLTWHRNVAVVTASNGDQSLSVTIPSSGGNPTGRNDPASSITVYPNDRTNGAAQVIYTLTGGSSGTLNCVSKDGGSFPAGFQARAEGNTLTITDGPTAADTVDFSYYVKLGTVSTPDPMIHNEVPPVEDN